MKKGFTLSEVLVAMTIIGIIGLLTVPSLITHYHKNTQYTQFLKVYNTLTSVMDIVQADHKRPNRWPFDKNNPAQTSKDIIYPHLGVLKVCEAQGTDKCVDYEASTLGGADSGSASTFFLGNGSTVFLEDGTILSVVYVSAENKITGIRFYFDTNGAEEPNIVGRDIFLLFYGPLARTGRWAFDLEGQIYQASECDPSNSNSMGTGCPAKLIKEGRMDY